ncbi:MAG: zinc ABC transporter substrate-binding protein [Bacilli bacterium]|nr:zinc ABC transporter substrate-binding protein [Bacilli bacterium]
MKNFKYFILTMLFILPLFLTTGCTNDSMDNIDIIVTNYANEYITKNLYEDHATITSIYPDGVDISNYKISNKQKQDFAKYDLFVYNGLLEKERNLALELLDLNPNLKIIDTAYVLETDYSPEELWLNPSSLLMMGQNVRLGLQEYITSTYLKNEVDEKYNELKIELSELDVEFRVAFDSTDNNTIIVADSALVYLEKFGLNVICIDSDATQKTLSDAENLIANQSVSYIFGFRNQKAGDNAQKLLDTYSTVKYVELHKLDNITDEERREKKDYTLLASDNLELIKREIYQ